MEDFINDPLVSVIIPVYNVLPYLRESLDSVLAQTYQNLEILVIDDGSTDGSGEICDEYQQKDQRIRVIHQENRGLSAARNAGLDRMMGEIVAFLDPDDDYLPDMIRIMTDVMKRYQADIVCCKHARVKTNRQMNIERIRDINDKLPGQEMIIKPAEALSALIDERIPFPVWNKIYTKQIWEKLRFPEGHVYEDVRTIYLLFEKADCIGTIDQILVLHRIRAGSITRTKTVKNVMDSFLAMKILEAYVVQHTPGIFTEEQKKRFQEKNLRRMIIRYSRWLICPTAENNKVREELKRDIFRKKEELGKHFYFRKTTVTWWMFNHCPQLIPPVQNIFGISKRIFIKK